LTSSHNNFSFNFTLPFSPCLCSDGNVDDALMKLVYRTLSHIIHRIIWNRMSPPLRRTFNEHLFSDDELLSFYVTDSGCTAVGQPQHCLFPIFLFEHAHELTSLLPLNP
jgi:hypothetical protein